MGLWSSIKSGAKKITKGVTKVFKKVGGVVKKVATAVKKFSKSKLGKVLIAAAAIYFGGAALGQWSAPGVPQGGFMGSVKTAQGAGVDLASSTIAPGTTGSTIPDSGVNGGDTSESGGMLGMIGSGIDKMGQWAEANPTLANMGGKLIGNVGSALAAGDPAEQFQQRDYIKEMREQAALQEQARKNVQADTNIAGVSYAGGGTPLNMSLLRQAQAADQQQAPTAGTAQYDPVTGQPLAAAPAYTPTYNA
jgi:hypothetical protein